MSHSEDADVLRPPTPEVDARVSELASRLQSSATRDTTVGSGKDIDDAFSDDEDEDKLFEELEKDEFDMSGLREKRLEELKAQISQVRDMRENEHGRLTEITDEKEVIKTSANESRCIIHFYHRDFRRCDIMNKHLEILASRHFKTRFIKVFVENVPWLVEKLQVKVLPCVICFVRGVSKDKIIGFEEIGNEDGFKTAKLELRLTQSGVIDKPDEPRQKLITPFGTAGMVGSSSSRIRGREGSDDDYDD
ncbi:Queuine tRNA-ribosyltransferase-like protein OS=Schizosaccharomyces pombe (strain 972 / ATCC 24843) GN=SPAC2F3,13c PE=3 SV=4 [Rhizoctonia solani AG-1 IB]|uniref:Queuine tRNA-ribosyltransferase-like protein n=1 Tax=Thanatephorus cucumeris (strain AG1-IB / isolate 7/3/14) TaxID=1108050 RepID=A0A0B7FPC8_THACB|nr:Queuine tRNA-ribosyltransferase-like protein OS=Schizosaccharomyces pombe (strain 972 / ATCC 24843) GN=SPAC2F3,13c PE=3 SV=4 [Rhizoctonia solani AG-1 IB]